MNARVDVELLMLYNFEVQITITRVTGTWPKGLPSLTRTNNTATFKCVKTDIILVTRS